MQNNLQIQILVTRNFAIILDILKQVFLPAYTTHLILFALLFSTVLSTLGQRTIFAQ